MARKKSPIARRGRPFLDDTVNLDLMEDFIVQGVAATPTEAARMVERLLPRGHSAAATRSRLERKYRSDPNASARMDRALRKRAAVFEIMMQKRVGIGPLFDPQTWVDAMHLARQRSEADQVVSLHKSHVRGILDEFERWWAEEMSVTGAPNDAAAQRRRFVEGLRHAADTLEQYDPALVYKWDQK